LRDHAAHLDELFRREKIDCVVDAGAHLGQFGRLVRACGYEGEIVSFEPVLAVFAALTKTCCSGDPRWQAHRIALGSHDGSGVVNVARSTDFSSVLEPNGYSLAEFRGFTAVENRERVAMRRLDAVAAEYVPGAAGRIFLKVDTQGSELEVLRGAEETLRRVAAVQVELSMKPLYKGMPRYHEVAAHLDARGFEPTGFFPVSRDGELRLIDVDCVMVRRADG
jgi:FkbM family methyltransferase